MADISIIELPSGDSYNIKDAAARASIPTKTSDLDNDSGYITSISIEAKADKVSGATTGNLASLDSNGNLADSGSKASDFLTSHQDISGKADKTDTVLLTTLSRGRATGTGVGTGSFVFGHNLAAIGDYSFAIGGNNIARGSITFVGGRDNIAYGDETHVFGRYSERDVLEPDWESGHEYSLNDKAIYNSHLMMCIEANSDTTFNPSKWEEVSYPSNFLEVVGNGSSLERSNARTLDFNGNERLKGKLYINADKYGLNGDEVLTRGTGRKANTTDGSYSLALGANNEASSYYAVALGINCKASGISATAIGWVSKATADYAVSLGGANTASGNSSTAIGSSNTSSGYGSVALGLSNTASQIGALAIGQGNTASSATASAIGSYTIANAKSQFAFGEYNVADTASTSNRGTYIETVGNGTADNARSNARTLDWSGNMQLAGDLTLNAFGNSPISLASRVVPFTGVNNGTAGTMGLVPAPSPYTFALPTFLSADGTWQDVTGLRQITSLSKGTNPSSTTYYVASYAYDKNGTDTKNRLCALRGYVTSAGISCVQLVATCFASQSTTTNTFVVGTKLDGTAYYSVGSPDVFRTAISAVGKGCTWGDIKNTSSGASATTTNFSLTKPGYTDVADIATINSDLDTIDTEIYKSRVLRITKNSVTSLPVTISNSKITSTMECIHMYVSNRLAMYSSWTVTTANGSVTVSGTTSGTSANIILWLAEAM